MVSSPISSGVVIVYGLLWVIYHMDLGLLQLSGFFRKSRRSQKRYETKLAALYLSEPRRSSRKAGAATRITSRAAAVNPIIYTGLPRSLFALLDMSSLAQSRRDCSLPIHKDAADHPATRPSWVRKIISIGDTGPSYARKTISNNPIPRIRPYSDRLSHLF